jgi:hypothetical protein
MEMLDDLDEPALTFEDLEIDIDWIIEYHSHGAFSRDASQFLLRIPIAKRSVPIVRTP